MFKKKKNQIKSSRTKAADRKRSVQEKGEGCVYLNVLVRQAKIRTKKPQIPKSNQKHYDSH